MWYLMVNVNPLIFYVQYLPPSNVGRTSRTWLGHVYLCEFFSSICLIGICKQTSIVVGSWLLPNMLPLLEINQNLHCCNSKHTFFYIIYKPTHKLRRVLINFVNDSNWSWNIYQAGFDMWLVKNCSAMNTSLNF